VTIPRKVISYLILVFILEIINIFII
jgi:UDP-sugar pyrophosphorylase